MRLAMGNFLLGKAGVFVSPSLKSADYCVRQYGRQFMAQVAIVSQPMAETDQDQKPSRRGEA